MEFSRELNIEDLDDIAAAGPIIKKVALDILKGNEGNDVPLRVIRHIVAEVTGKEFSGGSFSGAMRDLVEESRGRVVNSDRGIYRYERNIKKREINDAIDNLIKELDNIATDNILKISDEDLEVIRRIPSIQDSLYLLKIK